MDRSDGTGDIGGLKPREMLLCELLTAESLSESSYSIRVFLCTVFGLLRSPSGELAVEANSKL